jgi:hypothetical protein
MMSYGTEVVSTRPCDYITNNIVEVFNTQTYPEFNIENMTTTKHIRSSTHQHRN